MAIVISGVNNNDKITASDGTIDLLSGVSYAGIITAPAFSTPGNITASGNLTAGHLNIGSGIQLGNAGVATATTFVGNLTGNVNNTGNLLLQIGGLEKFRVGSSGQLGIGGANYGNSGQVLSSGGPSSAATWQTIDLSNLSATNLTSGTIPDARFPATLPAIDGSALTGVGVGTADSINTSGIITATAFVSTSQEALSHRNRIINGAMQVWQRGYIFSSQGNGQNDYTADRWAIGHNNSHMATVTQATGPDNDFLYCARVQRDSGNSQTDQMRFHTALETKDVRSLRNKILTISYYARKGANYSEANSKITGVRIATGENTDGDPNAYSGGHWTNSTTILTGTPTLTTSWQRFTHTTSAVSTSANSMIIEFRHTPVGTAGANDYYEIAGVQLEIGSVATPFEHRTFQEEELRCQRYFWKHPGSLYGGAYGGAGFCTFSLPVTMRTTGAVSYTAIRTSSGYYDYSTPKSFQIYMNATNPYISNPQLDSEL